MKYVFALSEQEQRAAVTGTENGGTVLNDCHPCFLTDRAKQWAGLSSRHYIWRKQSNKQQNERAKEGMKIECFVSDRSTLEDKNASKSLSMCLPNRKFASSVETNNSAGRICSCQLLCFVLAASAAFKFSATVFTTQHYHDARCIKSVGFEAR
ncbi:hypothetical protein LSTR_LSTR004389 [Laodelphax striatellus]|uniref:Uncharacterized protein n=1 Tax=Laodelphax striatellus TaxID=195883 RepID=A0A482X9S3_LAOST|nr:hypothetical protein LSTR_LSTR004389 [Laodelphax striatellus]